MPLPLLRKLLGRRSTAGRARLGLVPLEGRVVPSATLFVDDDRNQYPAAGFTSIQAAVDAASAGDVIRVAPGLYNEVVTVKKDNLTLIGSGPVVAQRTGDPNQESVVRAVSADPLGVINLWANNVVLRGFTVGAGVDYAGHPFPGNTLGPGIFTHPEFSGYVIKDNLVQGNNPIDNDPHAPSGGLHLNSNGAYPTVVQGNAFKNHTAESHGDGVYSELAVHNAAITGNYFEGNVHYSVDFAGAAQPLPLFVRDYGIKLHYEPSSDVVVRNNTIVLSGGVLVQYARRIDVSHNTIDDATRTGVYVGGHVHGVTVANNSLNGAVAVDNMFRRGKHTGIFVGTLDIRGPIQDVVVSGNTITGYRNGIWLAGSATTGTVVRVVVEDN